MPLYQLSHAKSTGEYSIQQISYLIYEQKTLSQQIAGTIAGRQRRLTHKNHTVAALSTLQTLDPNPKRSNQQRDSLNLADVRAGQVDLLRGLDDEHWVCHSGPGLCGFCPSMTDNIIQKPLHRPDVPANSSTYTHRKRFPMSRILVPGSPVIIHTHVTLIPAMKKVQNSHIRGCFVFGRGVLGKVT